MFRREYVLTPAFICKVTTSLLLSCGHWSCFSLGFFNPIHNFSKYDFVLKKWVFPFSLFYIERKMWTRRFYWPYQRQNDYMWGMLKRSARRTWCHCSRFYTIMLVRAGKNVGKKISNDSIILYNRFYIW